MSLFEIQPLPDIASHNLVGIISTHRHSSIQFSSRGLVINVHTILVPASIVHIGNRHQIGHYFYDVLQVKCSAYAALIENISMTFISYVCETAMRSHGHVTTALLKQANEEYYRGAFQKVMRIRP